MFLQYNDAITRHSVVSWRNGRVTQVEAGPFLEFLELMIAPLNRFFCSLRKNYSAAPVSCASVARMAVDFTPDQLRMQRQETETNGPEATQLHP
jgi:hypothetical protein